MTVRARLIVGALLAAALVLPASTVPAQQRPAAAARDWTQVAVRTQQGGFRIGNPNARVKVIEFLSLACPHCASFAAESDQPLFDNYVRSGRVSVEYRNIVLHGADAAATVLTRCAEPSDYLAMSRELLRTQPQWLGRINDLTAQQRRELGGLTPLQTIQRLVSWLGLDQVAARHGLTPEEQRACTANQANLNRIQAMQNAASTQFGVTGTPSFIINGRLAETNVWSGIEPLLQARR